MILAQSEVRKSLTRQLVKLDYHMRSAAYEEEEASTQDTRQGAETEPI